MRYGINTESEGAATRRCSKVYGLRLDDETHTLASRVAKSRGTDLAAYIRELIRLDLARLSYLSEEDKKALGVEVKR